MPTTTAPEWTRNVTLGREVLGSASITVIDDGDLDDDGNPIPTYLAKTDEAEDVSTDKTEARDLLAGLIRDQRNGEMAAIEDARRDEAQELLDALIEAGRAGDVLRALQALQGK